MRILGTIAVTATVLGLTTAAGAAGGQQAAGAANQPTAEQVEARIIQQIRAIEAQLAKEEQLLRQRMTYAHQLRERGLQEKDQRLLDQAEQIERQAVAYYEQQVRRFERIEAPQGQTPSAPGRQSAAPAPAVRPSAAGNPAPREPQQPNTLRRLIGL